MFKRKRSVSDNARQPLRGVTPRPVSVFSYHAVRDKREDNETRQPEVLQQRQQSMGEYGRRVLIVVGAVFVLLLLGSTTILKPQPKVTVLGTLTDQSLLQDTSVYERTARDLFAATPANQNKLTANTTAIAVKLQARYPELASVSVSLPVFSRAPQIKVQPAVPTLLLKTNTGSVFVVARSGRVLAQASTVRNLASMKLPTVDDQSGLPLQVGKAALPSTSVNFMQHILQQYKAKNIPISAMTLPGGHSQIDVRLHNKPYVVKFNLEADVRQQIGTYFAMQGYLDQKHITPGQYIDVRTLGRAYYK